MEKVDSRYVRLPLRFHQTFMPERRYLSLLLGFCGEDGTGADLEISEKTGIPTGKSSGKVPSTIQYAKGMGLVEIDGKGKNRRLRPTAFGKAVLAGDPYLGEPVTQWMAHLHLCRRSGGAHAWFLLFARSGSVLGVEFSRERLEDYLAGVFGRAKRSLIGPMLRAYEDEAALKATGALWVEENSIARKPAPLNREFRFGFAAFLLGLWEEHFPEHRQATPTDFEAETCWGAIHGWNEGRMEKALDLVRETGAVEIDKQMRPWVMTKTGSSEGLWPSLYKKGD